MVIKKGSQEESDEIVSEYFRKILGLVDISDIKILDKLEGEERRDFCRFCHFTYHSPHFELIFKNFIYAQVMLVSEREIDYRTYINGKMVVNGIAAMRELFKKYANIYDTEFAAGKKEFDPYKSFEPSKNNY